MLKQWKEPKLVIFTEGKDVLQESTAYAGEENDNDGYDKLW